MGSDAAADKAQARIHYERATAQYNLGEYQSALDEFQAAYKEFRDSVLLFNIAQCHRQLGNRQKAVTVYKSFLRETEGQTQNAEEVRRIVARLEQEIAKNADNEKGATAVPISPSVVVEANPPPTNTAVAAANGRPEEPVRKKSRARVWGVAVGSVVVVGLAVGLGVGLSLQPGTPAASFGTVTVR